MKPSFPVARFLLSRFVRGDALEAISGDLDEEYALHVRPSRGRLGAWGWYWRETLRSIRARRTGGNGRMSHDPRVSLLRHHLVCAARSLRASPATTVVACVTLALGIGASTLVFSVANAVLLRPLPYGQADELVTVWDSNPDRGFPTMGPTPANYLDWQERSQSFESLAALAPFTATLTGAGEPRRLEGQRTAAGLFPLLRTPALLGRWFLPDEDIPGNDVVIISHGVWVDVLGRDPEVVGRRLTLNNRTRTVVGVMPAGFRMPPVSWATGQRDDVWIPMGFSNEERTRRASHFLTVVGRLKPGIALRSAQAEMDGLVSQLATEFPRTNTGIVVLLRSMREQFAGDLRPLLRIFGAAAVLLLVIACLNVAHLLVSRSTARRRELSVRAALGASGRQLAAQLATEGALLAAAGAVPGVALASVALPSLAALAPAGLLPVTPVALDWRMAGFAALLITGVALACALTPLLQLGRLSNVALHHAARTPAGAAGRRLRGGLVVAEIALACVLLVSAGLLVRSFVQLLSVDPGFRPERVLTMRVELPRTRYRGPAEWAAFFDAALERLRALPGVDAAGGISWLPLTTRGNSNAVRAEHQPPPPPGTTTYANYRLVTPGYFEAIGVDLRRGRTFAETDRSGAPRVAVINQTMAARFWPGENPVGKRLTFRPDAPDDASWLTVVGVVADMRQGALSDPVDLEMFAPFAQDPFWFPPSDLVIRAGGDPRALAASARDVVWAIDPALPVTRVQTLDDILSGSVSGERFMLVLVGVFALAALVLAALGIYGVVAFAVAQRTREIGVRSALGARRTAVLGLVLRQGLALALAGAILGCAGALVATRLLEAQLFEVAPTDPATFLSVAAVLVGTAVLACYVPARRALRVNPIVALRSE